MTEQKPVFWRWQHLIALVTGLAGVIVGVMMGPTIHVLPYPPPLAPWKEPAPPPISPETPIEKATPMMVPGGLPTDKETGREPSIETAQSTPELPLGYVNLGPPIVREDCHTPRFATGSAWQVGRVEMSGRNYESAYFCNLFSAGVGSLDFVLSNSYRELRVTIGIADDSGWLQHRVKFEIIGDDRVYLEDPVILQVGNKPADLKVNVMGISRLKLKITELGSPGAGDSPSKPVWASPIAVPLS